MDTENEPKRTEPEGGAGEPKAPEPAEPKDGAPDGAKGKPDAAIAASKYKQERDEAREKVADLTAQLETLRESVKGLKTAEDVQAAVDEALSKSNSEFEATKQKWEQRERELAVSTELAQAGCIDAKAACAHIDLSQVAVGDDGKVSGLDLDALKGSYPYLFGVRQQAGSTGLKPGGAPAADTALAKARAQFGLKENPDG